VNLLGNALKFTEKGEVVVNVDAEPVNGHQRVRVAVKDTGIGIPPAGMDRLFKSFSQVDASTTRRFGGTGLGLAISKRLVELMGGSMWAESEVGKGSTFHFTVLVETRPDLPEPPQSSHPELEGRRLLVVDDNATNRRVVSGLATSWGMVVHEAASAREALTLMDQDERYDIAVLDMHMPEMNGEQLAQAIRALPAGDAIPLVLLTSLGRRTRSLEFAQSLAKPIKADALRSVIRASLKRQQTTGKSNAPFQPATIDTTLGRRCPLRLLIAEDNLVNQRVAGLLLQRLGYHPTIVANGLEAIAAINEADYDAILMDVEMPELDGCEATRRIRTLRRSMTHPWIIALTAGAMQSDRERALGSGMNDFLTKPVRTESLAAALERAHAEIGGKEEGRKIGKEET
jgi:CheY-like chemotaxis protein